jgi:hypothetical protein
MEVRGAAMSSKDDGPPDPKWRADLRLSENPYATHYYEPSDRGPARTANDLYRLSENPHARDYYLGSERSERPSTVPTTSAVSPADRKTISKMDFEAGCRAIFKRYMPEMERSKLRSHHQEFIRRNAAATPERRYALLQELRRYDLSSEDGLRTYFNLEEDAFTEAKLRKIEESVNQD